MMLIIKIQMPEGSHLRDVYNLVQPSVMDMKFLLEGHYSAKLDDPVVETGE